MTRTLSGISYVYDEPYKPTKDESKWCESLENVPS
ncbi:unnamed protein product, partial [Rotaria socialis]